MDEFFSRDKYQSGPYTMTVRKGFGEPAMTSVTFRSEDPEALPLHYMDEGIYVKPPITVPAKQAEAFQQKLTVAFNAAKEFDKILRESGVVK